MRPDSTMTLPRSMRLTVPVTQLVAARQEVVQDLLALGVADLLQDHLLGGLRADAAELHGLESALRCSRRPSTSALPRSCGSSTESICAGSSRAPRRARTCPAAERLVVAGVRGRSARARRCPRCTSSWSPRRAPSRARRTRCRAATFFSRDSASTSINSSRFPATTAPARDHFPSQFRHQPRALDIVELQLTVLPSSSIVTRPPSAPRSTPTNRRRPVASGVRILTSALLAGEAREIRPLPQRPIEPGGRHLEPLVVHAFDLQHSRELTAYRRAVLDIDAARLVDEKAQHPPPIRRLQVDELVPHAGHYRLYHRFQCRHNSPRRR